jgi:hypothetical protein
VTKKKRKAYYDGCERARRHNEAAKDKDPMWILVDKDDECNTRDEDTMLRYLDQKKEAIDWYASMINLSSYGSRTGYTMNHYKRCIDRWVSYFAPNMRPVTELFSNIYDNNDETAINVSRSDAIT